MTRRFRPTDAFVDESIRGQRYLLGCLLVEARHLMPVRRAVAALVPPGKRLHFHEELDSTRRLALGLFATLPVTVDIVVCNRLHGVSEFEARDRCLATVVRRLQVDAVPALTIESRQDDRDDRRTIARARQPEPVLVFDHVDGRREPLLWVVDAVAWAYGAGGKWAPYVSGLVRHTVEPSG